MHDWVLRLAGPAAPDDERFELRLDGGGALSLPATTGLRHDVHL